MLLSCDTLRDFTIPKNRTNLATMASITLSKIKLPALASVAQWLRALAEAPKGHRFTSRPQ